MHEVKTRSVEISRLKNHFNFEFFRRNDRLLLFCDIFYLFLGGDHKSSIKFQKLKKSYNTNLQSCWHNESHRWKVNRAMSVFAPLSISFVADISYWMFLLWTTIVLFFSPILFTICMTLPEVPCWVGHYLMVRRLFYNH